MMDQPREERMESNGAEVGGSSTVSRLEDAEPAVGAQKKLFPMFSKARPAAGQNSSEQRDRPAKGATAASKSKNDASKDLTATTEKSMARVQEPAAADLPGPSTSKKLKAKASIKQASAPSTSMSSTRSKQRSASLQPNDASKSHLRSTTPPGPSGPFKHVDIIEIPDSPVKDSPPKQKTFADLATERKAKAKKPMSQHLPLWPCKQDIHVGLHDSQTASQRVQLPLSFDLKGKGRALPIDDSRLASQYPSRPTDYASTFGNAWARQAKQSNTGYLSGQAEPELEHLRDAHEENQELWSVRYAPAKAEKMLDRRNRENARQLKDWLVALSINDTGQADARVGLVSPKKRKIRREVTARERKRMKRDERRGRRRHASYSDEDDGLDDFIAADDEEEEGHQYLHSDASAFSSPAKSAASPEGADLGLLSNMIILTGPVASGKTASVHAVARELGWEVFEVYPGIGRRGAKDLERYVGMVGDNHLVNRENSVQRAASGLLGGSVIREELYNGASNKIRQSLILIEEVDILFPSDAGFWEGLVALAARSRRPIVLTCNDLFTIPHHLLPIQAVLTYVKPDLNLVNRYLACLLDKTEVPSSVPQHSSHPDLRRRLLMMQGGFDTPSPWHPAADGKDKPRQQPSLANLWTVLDNSSFADSAFNRESAVLDQSDDLSEQSLEDILQGHPDRGFTQLFPMALEVTGKPLPCFGLEADLSILYLGQQPSTAIPVEPENLLREGSSAVIDPFTTKLDSEASNLDYLPYIRKMIVADDEQEARYNEAVQMEEEDMVLDSRVRRSRRLAGNAKEPYRRYLLLGGETLDYFRSVTANLQVTEVQGVVI